jgi:hypothetical protein
LVENSFWACSVKLAHTNNNRGIALFIFLCISYLGYRYLSMFEL